MSTVHVIEEDGSFTAFDEETGTEVRGKTRSLALLALAAALHATTGENNRPVTVRDDEETTGTEFEELCANVQRRFEQHDVSEDDVEDAIKWARHQ